MRSSVLAPHQNEPAEVRRPTTAGLFHRIGPRDLLNGRRARALRFAMVGLLVLGWMVAAPAAVRQVTAASDPVVAAAGDIACDPLDNNYNNGVGTPTYCRQADTSNLLVNGGYAAVLALGDVQYYCGGAAAFTQVYDPTWGRVKAITHPVIGNHEILTSGGSTGATGCNSSNINGAGYFNYYGAAAGTPGQGYYSFDIGAWHLIALNSNCTQAGGCSARSPEGRWLAADLAAHANQCTLAYWHIPLFSSGGRANTNTLPFWQMLYSAHADVILDGHDHIYERFAPQTPAGVADPTNGITQFTVGTGGADHTGIASLAANSLVRNTNTYGVLALTLHPGSYSWHFVPAVGTFTDSGTASCHAVTSAPTPTPVPTTAPTASPTAAPTAGSTPTAAPTVAATPTAGASASPIVGSTTVLPVADSYVDNSNPTANFGTSTQLRIDGSPVVRSFLRFNVSGLAGTVTNATLRILANTAQATGYDVFSVADNTWGETAITDSNAPPFGAKLGSSGKLTAATWTSVDVTSAVAGNGTYSFGISTTNSTAASLSSREGANAPQLVITTSSPGAALPPPPSRSNPLLPVLFLFLPVLAPGLILLDRMPDRRSLKPGLGSAEFA